MLACLDLLASKPKYFVFISVDMLRFCLAFFEPIKLCENADNGLVAPHLKNKKLKNF